MIVNYAKLPDSSNLQVLYFYYVVLYAADMFYPLAIVFSFLFTLYYMIKFNEMVSFYSLGFTVTKILKPFVFLAFAVFFFFMLFDSSKLAYAREYADSILNKTRYSNTNLFIKFNNDVIYIKKIEPILQEAYDIKIFVLKDGKINKVVSAKKAVFKDNEWKIKNAKITYFTEDGIVKKIEDVNVLKNFKPKIVSNLKKLNSISFYDAYIAIKVFKDVNVNTLLSIVFYKIFTALSLMGLLVIFLFKAPLHQRISNVSLFLVKSVFLTIFVWGINLMIYKFSKQGVLSPYVLILPCIVIFVYGVGLMIKESNK
jgi:lipopolysaccharide export system permease protein